MAKCCKRNNHYYTYFKLRHAKFKCLVKGEAQWQTWEQNPMLWMWALCSNCRKHFCNSLYAIHSILTLKKMKTKILSLKIGQKVIVPLFQESKFCHACPEQGQESMKPPSVVLEVIKEEMQLTCQRPEKPKVISLCWCRGKGKERMHFPSL